MSRSFSVPTLTARFASRLPPRGGGSGKFIEIDSMDQVRDRYQFARELRKSLTPAERRIWAQLRGRRLYGFKFLRQAVIGPFIVDFVCHEKSLVIEVDGGIHRVTQDYDRQREGWLRNTGFRILRFWNDEVFGNLDGVLQQILDELNRIPSVTESSHSGRRRYRTSLPLEGGGTKGGGAELSSSGASRGLGDKVAMPKVGGCED